MYLHISFVMPQNLQTLRKYGIIQNSFACAKRLHSFKTYLLGGTEDGYKEKQEKEIYTDAKTDESEEENAGTQAGKKEPEVQ